MLTWAHDHLHFDRVLLFRPMEFSIKLHTIESGWSIVYIKRSQIIIFKNKCISFSDDRFSFSSIDAYEMPYKACADPEGDGTVIARL